MKDIRNDDSISFALVTSTYPEGILLTVVNRAGDLHSLGRDLRLTSSVEGEQIRVSVTTRAMHSATSWLGKGIDLLLGSDLPWFLRGEDLYHMLKQMYGRA